MSEEEEIKGLLGCDKIENLGTYLIRLGDLETDPSTVPEIAHIKTEKSGAKTESK